MQHIQSNIYMRIVRHPYTTNNQAQYLDLGRQVCVLLPERVDHALILGDVGLGEVRVGM